MEQNLLDSVFEHENLTVFRDPDTGVTGAIAIHSTALGPAMGGLRLFAYPDMSAALLDALRLARAMSFKSAAAGLDLGGGKAVLLDDGRWDADREGRMRAVGRAIESLDGRYITTEDVGTSPADMDVIGEVTDRVAGGKVSNGGSGDPSPFTARTVFAAIEAAARLRLERDSLSSVRVGVQGVGHVGAALVELLTEAGATVEVTDIDSRRSAEVASRYGAVDRPLEGFLFRELDVLAPCALGGVIGSDEVAQISASIVAGGANNPLTHPSVAAELASSGVLYVPDFIANCGGIIHVGAEALRIQPEAEELLADACRRVAQILAEAEERSLLPLEVAEAYALDRMTAAGAPASQRDG